MALAWTQSTARECTQGWSSEDTPVSQGCKSECTGTPHLVFSTWVFPSPPGRCGIAVTHHIWMGFQCPLQTPVWELVSILRY
jgi:hypothetical protein